MFKANSTSVWDEGDPQRTQTKRLRRWAFPRLRLRRIIGLHDTEDLIFLETCDDSAVGKRGGEQMGAYLLSWRTTSHNTMAHAYWQLSSLCKSSNGSLFFSSFLRQLWADLWREPRAHPSLRRTEQTPLRLSRLGTPQLILLWLVLTENNNCIYCIQKCL